MINFRKVLTNTGFIVTPLIALLIMLPCEVTAQPAPAEGDVRIEIDMLPTLTRAQTLSLTTLGIDTRGAGTRVVNLIIENTTDTKIDDLYLHVNVSASGIGTITNLDQRQGRPFSLRGGQVVVASNNDLQDGLPGVPETIEFTGELTSEGEDFINRLEGTTTLPDRVYSVELHIYHGNNRLNGGTQIAVATASLPVEEMYTELDFNLEDPGSEIGASLERITSTRPVFRWQGSSRQTYRLVVVEAVEGESPESLIHQALDTEPTIGADDPGDLLDFEMVDAIVRGNNFSYPATNAQTLQPGTRYYWQVFAHISTPTGMDLHPSPVWQFGIRRAGGFVSELDEEVLDMVSRFLPGIYQNLLLEGYTIESAEIDGQTVSGAQLLMEIEQFVDDLENGRIQILD